MKWQCSCGPHLLTFYQQALDRVEAEVIDHSPWKSMDAQCFIFLSLAIFSLFKSPMLLHLQLCILWLHNYYTMVVVELAAHHVQTKQHLSVENYKNAEPLHKVPVWLLRTGLNITGSWINSHVTILWIETLWSCIVSFRTDHVACRENIQNAKLDIAWYKQVITDSL